MNRVLLVALVVLASVRPAAAQTPDRWTVKHYAAGATAPISPGTDLLVANVQCNLLSGPGPAATTVNPDKIFFNDPFNANRFCVWTDPGTGLLASVPLGGPFTTTVTAAAGTFLAPESVPSPAWTHPGLTPAATTGVRVVK